MADQQRDAREIIAKWLFDHFTNEDAGPWDEATGRSYSCS